MKNKIIVLFSVLMLISSGASAQSIKLPTIVAASPEASSLAKYINYPVNHSSGLVEINIPLYEIKVGDLALPISLSYHASGIKANENSGIVGLGWTLNAEPSISRSIQGLEDSETGYWSSIYANMNYIQEQMYNMDLADSKNGKDEQPDKFYYKLLNKSGGFYISKKLRSIDPPKIVLHPYAPISIDNSMLPSIDVFNIVDEMGVRYNFSNKETTSRYPDLYAVTCWKASSITSSATSQVITFQYKTGSVEKTWNIGDRVEVRDKITGNTSGLTIPARTITDVVESGPTNTTNTTPLHISEINYSGGKVVFTMLTDASLGDKLKNIKVYNDTGIIKEFEFAYQNNFKLDSISVLDKNSIPIETYQLDYHEIDYNDQGNNYDHLGAKSADYWGYYNGAINDRMDSYVPWTTITVSKDRDSYGNIEENVGIGSATRGPDTFLGLGRSLNSMTNSLKKITYPTGGYTEFIYERNKYKEDNQLKIAGGLRIKAVRSVGTTTIERTYVYGHDEDGSGLLRSPVTTEEFSIEQEDKVFDSSSNQNLLYKCRNRTYYSNPITDLFYSGGCPVFYDFVTEYITDGSGNSLGKTEYEYRSEGTGGYGGNYRFPKTSLIVDLDWEWKFGQLLSKKVYKGNLATKTFDLVSSNSYSYNTINASENSIHVGKAFRTINLVNYQSYKDGNAYQTQEDSFLYQSYTIPTGAIVVSSDTITNYRDNKPTIKVVNDYTYGNSVFPSPTQIKTTSSEGVDVITKNKYPHDLTLTGSAETARQKLISDFRVGTLLEQSKEKGTSIVKTRTDYGIFNGKAQPASVVTNTGANFADESRIVYDNYDANGNLLGVSKNNNDKVCYVWSYNKLYPVAKIENATYAQVEALAGFGVGFTIATSLSAAQETALRSLPNAMVTTFKYSPMIGVTRITDPKGLTTYYEYDSFNRLAVIKDHNSKIVKTFCYNYQGQAENCVKIIEYKSVIKTGSYKKNNCPAGYGGSSVVYTVAAGAYGSTVSQAAADNLAQADVTANGQTYANSNGPCVALPVAPTGLAFTSATTSTINCSWNAVAGATGYNLWADGVIVGYSGANMSTLQGLISGTTYGIQVQACTALGNGALSTTVSMSTLPGVPNAVTGLTFTNATTSSLNFSWTAVAGATGYKIYKNEDYASTIVAPAATGSLSGLTSATIYPIRVLAYNIVGDGALSSSVSMTTATTTTGFYKTSGTYPTISGSSLNGTVVNKLASSIYVYLVVQSAGTSSGSGNGSATVNGNSMSASGTYTNYGQNFPSSSYAIVPSGGTVTATGNYYGTGVSQMELAYSLYPGGPLTYWPNSNQ